MNIKHYNRPNWGSPTYLWCLNCPVWYCRVWKGTGSQVDVILNKEARAVSSFLGSMKLLWTFLVTVYQGHVVLLPYLYYWVDLCLLRVFRYGYARSRTCLLDLYIREETMPHTDPWCEWALKVPFFSVHNTRFFLSKESQCVYPFLFLSFPLKLYSHLFSFIFLILRPNPHRTRDTTRNAMRANGTCWCE